LEPRILIACVGNIFLGDDAFGVEVARQLGERTFPGGVRVVDFGIRSYDLAYAIMDNWDLVILVDACPRGGEPGTIYVVEPDVPDTALDGSNTDRAHAAVDAHSMNPVSVLRMVQMLGGEVGRVLVVGCEPSPVDPAAEAEATELSAPVRGAIDEAIRTIEDLVAKFGTAQAVDHNL
jgi:hydrogenase maturation protease